MNIFVLIRAVTYAALFIGFVLVYLPSRFLSWSGIVAPATTGAPQVAGMIMVTVGPNCFSTKMPAKSQRVMKAMMEMDKIYINAWRRAKLRRGP